MIPFENIYNVPNADASDPIVGVQCVNSDGDTMDNNDTSGHSFSESVRDKYADDPMINPMKSSALFLTSIRFPKMH